MSRSPVAIATAAPTLPIQLHLPSGLTSQRGPPDDGAVLEMVGLVGWGRGARRIEFRGLRLVTAYAVLETPRAHGHSRRPGAERGKSRSADIDLIPADTPSVRCFPVGWPGVDEKPAPQWEDTLGT